MKLTFYGVRGSYPLATRENVRYGGNSTCFHLITRQGTELIMDGGSGIVNLGTDMLARGFGLGQGRATILVGHTHWDHILGYPFFEPFYRAGNHFNFVSAGQTGVNIREILSGQHDDLHFPVPFDALAATFEYQDFTIGEQLTVNEVRIGTFQLNHPGLTVGYRIEADGASIVILTDTARIHACRLGDNMGGLAPDEAYTASFTEALTEFVTGADVLVHDSHFYEHEIRGKEHWGHSTAEDALVLARHGLVRHLVLFHHAPEHSDAEVDEKLQNTRDLARDLPLIVSAAVEGACIEVSGDGPGGAGE